MPFNMNPTLRDILSSIPVVNSFVLSPKGVAETEYEQARAQKAKEEAMPSIPLSYVLGNPSAQTPSNAERGIRSMIGVPSGPLEQSEQETVNRARASAPEADVSLPPGVQDRMVSPAMADQIAQVKQRVALANSPNLYYDFTTHDLSQTPTANSTRIKGQVGATIDNQRQMATQNVPTFTPQEAVDKGSVPKNSRIVNPNMTSGSLDWNTASPTQKNLAVAMVHGSILPIDLSVRDRGAIVGLATDYAKQNNIPFTSYQGNVNRGMAENMAYGKFGQNANALNTALGHMADLKDAFDKINNTDVNFANRPINWLKENTNNPDIGPLQLNLSAVRGELANVFKQSGATDQEIAQFVGPLNENLTPAQAGPVLAKAAHLLNSRLSALQYQQKSVMGDNPQRDLLSPQGKDTMDKLGGPPSSGQPDYASELQGQNFTSRRAAINYLMQKYKMSYGDAYNTTAPLVQR